jgi:hypothetical protein
VSDYRFEERGLFSMEKHHFGTLTCYINIDGEFDSLYWGDKPIAEDGYFGEAALADRDRLIADFDAGLADAWDIRQSEIEAAREKYRQTENALAQERDSALEALRGSSQPPSEVQEVADTVTPMDGGDLLEAKEATATTAMPEQQVAQSLEIASDSDTELQRMFVVADRLTRRTCPSTTCGTLGELLYRQSVEVHEEQQGWARITKLYNASCINGISEYVDRGNARCDRNNGIIDGNVAEWVSLRFLSTDQPADPAETAQNGEELVAQSDDFRVHRETFARKAGELIEQGRCTEGDFEEWGGWTSSPSKGDGVYFIYCGGAHVDNRLYLDVRTGRVFQ